MVMCDPGTSASPLPFPGGTAGGDSNGHRELQLTAFLPIAVMNDKKVDFFWTLKGEADAHSSFCRAHINMSFGYP